MQFPSPCGEKVGINAYVVGGSVRDALFPSPCGEKVGINTEKVNATPIKLAKFPSPCGEKVGINHYYWGLGPKGNRLGFRPLAGKR